MKKDAFGVAVNGVLDSAIKGEPASTSEDAPKVALNNLH